jgi:hypothetical protein
MEIFGHNLPILYIPTFKDRLMRFDVCGINDLFKVIWWIGPYSSSCGIVGIFLEWDCIKMRDLLCKTYV